MIRPVGTDCNGPRQEKTGLRCFHPGPAFTGLYSHRRRLEAWNFELGKTMDCTIIEAKTKLCSYCTADLRLCFRTDKSPFYDAS